MRFAVIAICVLAAGIVASCNWKTAPQGSILVIFVENLGFNSFSCSESAESGRRAGLQTFCDEGVRFTHAYTPSTLSQATIASIFTAKAPHQHGLRHNGSQTLSAKMETVAEAALARGYRTCSSPEERRFGAGSVSRSLRSASV